jgi:hypothetical protein
MPPSNTKHVLILSEAFDVRRFQPGTSQQEFWLAVKGGDGDQCFVHFEALSQR